MDNKFYKAKEIIASKLELPRDILLDLPKITILANNEINIENHKGVVIFEEEEIKINSNVGPISIYGKKLDQHLNLFLFLALSKITTPLWFSIFISLLAKIVIFGKSNKISLGNSNLLAIVLSFL